MAEMSVPVLAPELLGIIFSNLEDYADFYSLCLVSRSFYTVAIRFLYRRLKIPHGTYGRAVTPLHAVLSSDQQERVLLYSAMEMGEPARTSGKGFEFGEVLSDCGRFVREFEVARPMSGNEEEEDVPITREIIASAIENMSLLESVVWTTPTLGTFRRTFRISSCLASKPRLRSLSLSNVGESDAPLLRLRPLQSVTFTLDSNFASLAHRPIPSTADYDIIRKILKTSAGTLNSLTLIDRKGVERRYEDENMLFGGGEGDHKSVYEDLSPEGGTVTRLSKLESLTLVERPFTVKRLEVFTQAIDFNTLRCLRILSCPGSELLLSAITCKGIEWGMGMEGTSEEGNSMFPNLRTFAIRSTQPALKRFLLCFRGLQDLRYEQAGDPTDWVTPGGNRRHVSSPLITQDLLEAIASHHGKTLQRLTILSLGEWKYVNEAGMNVLTRECPALVKLCCCIAGYTFVLILPIPHPFPSAICASLMISQGDQSRETHVPSNLSTLYLQLRGTMSESESREFSQKVLRRIPKLKTVGMTVGGHLYKPYVWRVSPGGVPENVVVGDCLSRGLRNGEFED